MEKDPIYSTDCNNDSCNYPDRHNHGFWCDYECTECHGVNANHPEGGIR